MLTAPLQDATGMPWRRYRVQRRHCGEQLMEQLRDLPGEVPAPIAGLTAAERRELAPLIDEMRAGAGS